MTDPIGTITAWALILAAAGLIVYHFAIALKHRRLETRNAAAILFGTGWLIIVLPQRFYEGLPADAVNTLNWLGIFAVLASIALDVQGIRTRGKDKVPAQPAA